ncbi:hypothetical protein GCM10011348_41140 [Marinobacterium nitratireducens]|uniref:DUF2066 domain-containing protein n=1 Tax=Marinobacterium nitratireducens TaxID=518897 RepID=A0A917ZP33_9GAMM|nr:DUF2066 domain-containing protein [Marinobacterium nitratireducens]GGO87591.1 hypothetical protein GCM10011348_41140 [Marinobacterium nitratireducens]
MTVKRLLGAVGIDRFGLFHKRQQLLWLIPVLLLLCGGQARALTVVGLHSAELEVAQLETEPTPQQTLDGLAQVLVKLSGRRDVASSEGYRGILEQAPMLLSQYRFRPKENGALLELKYDAPALDRLLSEAGIRGPGTQRPAVLLWLAVDDSGRLDYAPPDHPALLALERRARQRGLPLQQPLLDLQDQVALPPQALRELSDAAVREASARYRPDAILMGWVFAEGGVWHSRFNLLAQGESRTLAPDGDLAAQMAEAADSAADLLLLGGAPRQAFSYRPRGLVLDIEGVDSQSAYLQLISLLRGTEGVSAVFPERFSQGRLQLRVQLETSVARLQQTLELEPRLQEIPQFGSAQPGDTGLLQYRWSGLGEAAQ